MKTDRGFKFTALVLPSTEEFDSLREVSKGNAQAASARQKD